MTGAGAESLSLRDTLLADPRPPLSPRVTRTETLARDTQLPEVPGGAPGNEWGGHQSRIITRSGGELLATYLASPAGITDPSRARWVLMRRGPGRNDHWVELARRRAGREPMHLVRAPDDTAFIVSWPGRPHLWRVRGDSLGPARRIPGAWERMTGSSTPYSGVAIGPGGRLCLAASRGVAGTVPGAPYTADSAWDLSCRAPGGRWTPMRTLPIGLRYCYPYLHVRAGGGIDLVGSRDVTWEAIGYPQVPGAFDYLFDAVDRWHSGSATDVQPTRQPVGTMPFTAPATVAPWYWQSDSLVDRRGQLHVLVQSQRSTGEWRMEHVIVRTDGSISRADIRVGSYTDGALRLIEDPFGRLLVLFIQSDAQYLYPTLDADGLVLGRRVNLTSALTAGGSAIGPAYVTSLRGGTARSRLVDLLLAVRTPGGRVITRYARLRLY